MNKKESLPVTTRLIETILRLSIAHARARLSHSVDHVDVEAATELVDYSISVGGIHEEEGEEVHVQIEVSNIEEKIRHFRERGNTGNSTNMDFEGLKYILK